MSGTTEELKYVYITARDKLEIRKGDKFRGRV